MSHLQIMILRNQLYKPVQRRATFFFSEPVDVLHVVADGENGFPACDGIRTDYGVLGGEVCAGIFGGAAGRAVEGKVVGGGRGVEFGLGVGGGEGFEELLVGRGEAVVEFVT
jgi:hypothetical protein